ncbi:hypothetical protein PSN45_003602 [Yamadazyma tenuis]|uniref:EF-hand domain-containing protein n=1 Tax=Candida tenuis (strain ATCC 10573 / BCRC 21748 / CBS 615 / JCM 9827 / NBRC 10315 / NRRL Y-1498 / VKM Y-70) TaxID=590646 RepID=G3AZM9_CANTC|nr:uncharacterized protein CANTEDRAFT_102239 [Yamadazyma tenuis ATCC 10573]EGV65626.1 hypothetical protein CANTEDRAFT_102239 [Yamadazyma tenuis ATCC 10573]WEJ96067.1 hypothetical protein PSN45_003602 [Yamadazyma tenuis]
MRLLSIFLVTTAVVAHGTNDIKAKPEGISWQDWHMLEEHQIEQYDPITFFKIHDLNDNGRWETTDILNIYGLARDTVVGDGSGMGQHEHGHETITQQAKDHVVETILSLMATNGDRHISAQNWVDFTSSGKQLPDFGYGQGHHLDFEREYEEHHWNQYHKDQDPEVLIKHKEDIEHEMLHHEHEIEQSHNMAPDIRGITKNFQSPIKLHNLPAKYTK